MASVIHPRLALKIDIDTNWSKSTQRLLEGEVAISYHRTFDRAAKTYVDSDFLIKVGKRDVDGNLMLWKDAPYILATEISAEAKCNILKYIELHCKDFFATKDELVTALRQIQQQLDKVNARLSSRVKAGVYGDILVLSTDD